MYLLGGYRVINEYFKQCNGYFSLLYNEILPQSS
jgi:hypothetical protein